MARMEWDKRRDVERVRRMPSPLPIGVHPPSMKQLRYLRLLAEKTGTTFASPKSSATASVEIARLKTRLK